MLPLRVAENHLVMHISVIVISLDMIPPSVF